VLRDLLYLDFEKAASLLSQLEQGLARETEHTTEAASNFQGARVR
jgi:hypothetical protein